MTRSCRDEVPLSGLSLHEGDELRGELTPLPGQDASWVLLGELVLARPFRRSLNL